MVHRVKISTLQMVGPLDESVLLTDSKFNSIPSLANNCFMRIAFLKIVYFFIALGHHTFHNTFLLLNCVYDRSKNMYFLHIICRI